MFAEEPVGDGTVDQRPQQELVEVLDVFDGAEDALVGAFPNRRVGDDDRCCER